MELEGTPEDTLQAAGVCSGDLLWVMGPANHKKSDASSDRPGKPNTAMSVPVSAPKPLESATPHENTAEPSEASCLSSFAEDAMQMPREVGCSKSRLDSSAAAKVNAPTIVSPCVCRMKKHQNPEPATQNYCGECLTAAVKPHSAHTSSCC